MTQGPPTPLAVDLAKVTVGSWAKYNMTMGTMPPMSMKMALVSRSAAGNTLEMSVEGGLAAKARQGGHADDAPPGSEGNVQKLVLQVGANDPMEMPVQGAQGKQFAKPDPKKLVKEETVKVAAGSYKAKHYHDKTPQGDTVDFWVSESVAPLGLVKIEMTQKVEPDDQRPDQDGAGGGRQGRQAGHHQEAQAVRPERAGQADDGRRPGAGGAPPPAAK